MGRDWTKANVVPKNGLIGWYQDEPGVSGNNLILDYSPNASQLTSAPGHSALLLPQRLNGQPGWYFDGTADPLVSTDGLSNLKHLFILASADEAVFASNRGLCSDTGSTGFSLVGSSGTHKFLDRSADYTSSYKMADVLYPAATQEAPVANIPYLIEVQIAAGITLNDLQIGVDRGNSGTGWKGTFYELIAYNRLLNAVERQFLYEYIAMRYRVWSKTPGGLSIFPFAANRSRSLEPNGEAFISEPYSGPLKALVRNTTDVMEAPYALRLQEEFEAAKSFCRTYYPVTEFCFRDYKYNPARDFLARFTRLIREQGSETTYRFNYALGILLLSELDETPPTVPLGLTITGVGTTSISLSWLESTD
jgi:hypothetical protein